MTRVPKKVCLISSLSDPAGSLIHGHITRLLEETEPGPYAWRPEYSHHYCRERLIHADHVDREIDADLIIFLSRHASVNPVPLLTVHVTGNYTDAPFGGVPGHLPPACPHVMKGVLTALAARAPPGYGVSYEMTHHGPTELIHPSFFVEVGSTEKEWHDDHAALAAAKSVIYAEIPADPVTVIGFGGTHYAKRQTELALGTRAAFGHMVPTRQIPDLTLDLVVRMAEMSRAQAVYIDKKAVKTKDAGRLLEMAGKTGLPVVTGTEFSNLRGISFDTFPGIRAVSREGAPPGELMIGGLCGAGTPVPVDLRDDLFRLAVQSDPSRFEQSLQKLPLAWSGSGRVPVSGRFITFEPYAEAVRHDLIRLCVSIILSKEKASISGDTLTIRRMRFDPEKARKLGIPPGPAYSRLRSGNPVRTGEKDVTPEMVMGEDPFTLTIPGLSRYL